MSDIEEFVRRAIDCGFRIHKEFGPGLLESVYETLLAFSADAPAVELNVFVPPCLRVKQ